MRFIEKPKRSRGKRNLTIAEMVQGAKTGILPPKKPSQVKRVAKGVKAGAIAFGKGMKPQPLTKAQLKSKRVSQRKTKRQVRKIWRKLI